MNAEVAPTGGTPPFRFSPFADIGHALLIGPPRAGKSVWPSPVSQAFLADTTEYPDHPSDDKESRT